MTGKIDQTVERRRLAAAVLCAGLLSSCPAFAATRAGTPIANSATLGWMDGQARTTTSNTVTLVAAEDLDVTIVAERATVPVTSADSVAVGFVVTNTGNGGEDFTLAASSDRADVGVGRIALDRDGDGRYDAATDRALGDAALTLAPGESARVFVLVDAAQIAAVTRIGLTVTARTGSGTPGTVFPGAGDGGGDAIVGATGATGAAASVLTPSAALPTLAKSQSVRAPDGGTRVVAGAVVTYRLTASFPAATRAAVIDDPVPAGTVYLPGSLTLDDTALSDATDGDAGTASAAGIHVALGDVAAAGTRTVQFSVTIP